MPSFPQIALCFPSFALRPQPLQCIAISLISLMVTWRGRTVAADVDIDGNEGTDDADKGDNADYAQHADGGLSGEYTTLVQVGRHELT